MNPTKSVLTKVSLRRMLKVKSEYGYACTVLKRAIHNPTDKNVVRSNYEDVVIPNYNVQDYVWENMDRWADKTAVVCSQTGRGYTYEQGYKMTTSFAACLRKKMNLRDGDCIAIMLPNVPEFPLATLGAIHAGCVVTTINPLYTSDEVQRQILMADVKLVIANKNSYPTIQRALSSMKQQIPIIIVKQNGEEIPSGTINFAEFAEDFSLNKDCLKSVRRSPKDLVFLPYSSGTTGLPKGVQLTHRNIVANCEQFNQTNLSIIQPTTETHQDVLPSILPFYHIYGLTVTLLGNLAVGCKLVAVPKFQPESFVNTLTRHKCTVLHVAPPLVLFLGSHPIVEEKHLQSVRTIMSGAASLVATDVKRLLKKTKKDINFMQGYGLTETSPVVLMQEKGETNFSSVGSPVPNTEVKIVSIETQETLGPNEIGELWVRGPQVMEGYRNNAQANEEIFGPDRWLKTGDMGYFDVNKKFFITERLKELIKVKGFQVPPAELEGVLRDHPSVQDAAVIGISHPTSGEVPKAFVVAKDGHNLKEQEVKDFVAQKVASYKKLAEVQFIETIPKNSAGKILRRTLRSNYA